jgi:F5/8 type C domain-containing protein/Big-like domain-containing protein
MTALLFSMVSGGALHLNFTQKASAQLSMFQKATQIFAPSTTDCKKLPILGVAAKGNDGHIPTNVLDNNLNTRWSNLGIGSFIQADLGSKKTICSVDIAWYRGNLRQNNFVISVSTDGTSFTQVFRGKSSGTTLFAEKYNLPTGIEARYVRVTVNGNTENNWASITELSVDGFTTVPKNNLPTANNLKIQTTSNNNTVISLTGTDPIPNDILKFSIVDLPLNGNLSDGNSFDTVVYTPNHGFLGHDRFTYKVTDGRGEVSNVATVSITVVAPPPPPPTAKNLSVQTTSNANVTITLTGTDPIPNDKLKFSVVDQPINGMLFKDKIPDTVIYQPDLNGQFIGHDVFTYRATDRLGVNSTIATVFITVKAAPPPPPPTQKPTANNLTSSTSENKPVVITLTGSSPTNSALRFAVVTMPSHGSITSPTANTVTYTPTNGYFGPDSFTYRATDSHGVNSTIATVSITVNPVQQPPPTQKPTANNIIVHATRSSPVQIPLSGTSPIQNDILKFSVVTKPQNGVVTNGTVSSDKFYTANQGFTGTDSFTYKSIDGQGVSSDPATVTIIVGAGNSTGGGNTTSPGFDKFGVKELYPSKPGGEQWFFDANNPNGDPRTGTPNEGPHTSFTQKNPDGSWRVQSSEVRYGILTSTLFQENQIKTLNQKQMAAQGYMLRPNDWKNVELTAYLRVVHATSSSSNGASHIEFGAHGARNTSGGSVGGFDSSCEATAYHSNTYLTGRVKFEKDLKHTPGYSVESADPQKLNQVNTTEFKNGNWIGIKAVIYDFPNGSVKVEQWVDDHSSNAVPGNHWRKVLETVDHGQWGPTRGSIDGACGGGEFQIASWGGPIALFRWDNIDSMDIKDASVREITPPA